MPANLTPQYKKAEEEYRRATTAAERLTALEKMYREIPKHKGTDHLQGDLRRKISEAKDEADQEKKSGKKSAAVGVTRIPRQGAGQVILLGGPNAGKSRLLAELTNAKPVVEPYPFSTREALPGMMPWRDVKLQLVDTPPITADHFESAVLGMARAADAVLLCFDGSSDDAPEHTQALLDALAERKTRLDRESGFAEDDFSIVHVRTLMVVTRGDDPGLGTRLEFFDELVPEEQRPFDRMHVELERADSVERLRDAIYRLLDLVRVYTKVPGKKAEKTDPFALPAGSTVEDLATAVHRDLAASLKFAKVWGSAQHDGQSVGPDHILADEDMVELHT